MAATLESARRYQEILTTVDHQKQFAFDTIFDTTSFRARRRSKWKFKLLQRIAPKLRAVLGPEEKVRYITRGRRASWWEWYFGELIIGYLNRRALIVTDQRLILLQIGYRSKPKELIEQIRYAGIERVGRTLFGKTRLTFATGQRITLASVPRADRKFLGRLIEFTRTRAPRELVAVEDLCSYCYTPIAGRPMACPHCGGRFKSPRKAGLLSLMFPGVGDWYLGHPVFAAFEIAVAAVVWMAVVTRLFVDLTPGGEIVLAMLFLFASMHGGDALMTSRIARLGLYPAVTPKPRLRDALVQAVAILGVFWLAITATFTYINLQYRAEQETARANDPARLAQAERVAQITVADLGARVAARQSEWSIVVLYDLRNSGTHAIFPELVALHDRYGARGVAFQVFSTDVDYYVPDIPAFLEHHKAPFPPVHVQRWPTGQLSATMTPLGINVGATWTAPLVALLDRAGTVHWQGQQVQTLQPLAALLRQRMPD